MTIAAIKSEPTLWDIKADIVAIQADIKALDLRIDALLKSENRECFWFARVKNEITNRSQLYETIGRLRQAALLLDTL